MRRSVGWRACSLMVFVWNLFLSTVSQGCPCFCHPCTSGAHRLDQQGPWGNLDRVHAELPGDIDSAWPGEPPPDTQHSDLGIPSEVARAAGWQLASQNCGPVLSGQHPG